MVHRGTLARACSSLAGRIPYAPHSFRHGTLRQLWRAVLYAHGTLPWPLCSAQQCSSHVCAQVAALSCLLRGVPVPPTLALLGGRLGAWLQGAVGLRDVAWLAPSVR